MRKVMLDFDGALLRGLTTRREIQGYIAERMDFPDYYGHNLDALYDCLTDISEPVTVGIKMPAALQDWDEENGEDADGGFKTLRYLANIRRTFDDAEKGNPNLAVWYL